MNDLFSLILKNSKALYNVSEFPSVSFFGNLNDFSKIVQCSLPMCIHTLEKFFTRKGVLMFVNLTFNVSENLTCSFVILHPEPLVSFGTF